MIRTRIGLDPEVCRKAAERVARKRQDKKYAGTNEIRMELDRLNAWPSEFIEKSLILLKNVEIRHVIRMLKGTDAEFANILVDDEDNPGEKIKVYRQLRLFDDVEWLEYLGTLKRRCVSANRELTRNVELCIKYRGERIRPEIQTLLFEDPSEDQDIP